MRTKLGRSRWPAPAQRASHLKSANPTTMIMRPIRTCCMRPSAVEPAARGPSIVALARAIAHRNYYAGWYLKLALTFARGDIGVELLKAARPPSRDATMEHASVSRHTLTRTGVSGKDSRGASPTSGASNAVAELAPPPGSSTSQPRRSS
jgi:hypothetical protein